jgi:hypothetical protein
MSGASTGRRAGFRRDLYLLLAGLALATLAALLRGHAFGEPRMPVLAEASAAPAEPAPRPNAPTEPVLGTRTPSPGEED